MCIRDSHYRHNHYRKIIFYSGYIAEKVTTQDKHTNPGNTTGDVIQDEFGVAHRANTGNKWGKCANDGYEAGNNNSFATMFFIKLICFYEVFFFKKTAVRKMKHFGTDKMTNEIINRIARNCRNTKGDQ